MNHVYEELVMWYVINGGQRFISPQFYVRDEAKTWECMPDFVAIDVVEKTIYIIEVNAGGSVANLAKRIGDNMQQACAYLGGMLNKGAIDFSLWPMKIRVFIRAEEEAAFHSALKREEREGSAFSSLDIHTIALEKTLRNWTWWDDPSGVVSLDGTPFIASE